MALDQGAFGTCVAHAFAKAFTVGILGKYNVSIDVGKIKDALVTEGNCWEGTHLDKMCEEWNAKFQHKWFTDISNQCRYRIKAKFKLSKSIEECHAYIKRNQGVLVMMAGIKTDGHGHQHHAVAVDKALNNSVMRGINSWGNRPLIIWVQLHST